MSFGFIAKVRKDCAQTKPNIAIAEIVISNIQLQQYLDIMQARMGGKHLKDMKRMRKEKYVSSL